MANCHRKVRQKQKHLTRKQSKWNEVVGAVEGYQAAGSVEDAGSGQHSDQQAKLPLVETGEDRESGWVGQPSPVWRQLSPVWKGGRYELLEGGEMDPFSKLASGEGDTRSSFTPDCERGNESAHFGEPEVEEKCIHQNCGWNSFWCQKCHVWCCRHDFPCGEQPALPGAEEEDAKRLK